MPTKTIILLYTHLKDVYIHPYIMFKIQLFWSLSLPLTSFLSFTSHFCYLQKSPISFFFWALKGPKQNIKKSLLPLMNPRKRFLRGKSLSSFWSDSCRRRHFRSSKTSSFYSQISTYFTYVSICSPECILFIISSINLENEVEQSETCHLNRSFVYVVSP